MIACTLWWLVGRPASLPMLVSAAPLTGNALVETLLWGLLPVLPLLAGFATLFYVNWRPLRELRETLGHGLRALFPTNRNFDILLVSLAAGVGEELLFRGFLQGWLTESFGLAAGVLLASLAFALAHSLSWAYAIFAFLAGLFFAYLFFASGSLVAVILTHGIYDYFAILYYLRRWQPQTQVQG